MMKKRTAAIFLILGLIGGIFSCRKENSERLVGQCIYANDPVTIVVKKIEKEKLSVNTEILSISYEMTFDGGGQNAKNGAVEVAPSEAEAKGVEIGKKFHASMSRLVSGTCNPEPLYPELKDWK